MNNIIRLLRRKKKIKQNDMARSLNISPSYLCKIETGNQEPTEEFKTACAEFLNESTSFIFPENLDKKNIHTYNENLKNMLWSFRQEKGIKQYELAKLLGCSPAFLSKVEKGVQMPNEKFKKKCAKILKIKEIILFP